MVVVRSAVLPRDAAGIGAIDTSFTTSQVHDVDASGDWIRLTIRDPETPLSKRFPLDDLESPICTWIQRTGGGIVEDHRCERGARHLWLETSSFNAPGIAAYRALASP